MHSKGICVPGDATRSRATRADYGHRPRRDVRCAGVPRRHLEYAYDVFGEAFDGEGAAADGGED